MGENDKQEKGDTKQEYVTIPYAYRSDEVIETKEVTKEWFEHFQQIKRVVDELAEEYQSNPNITRVAYTKNDQKTTGDNPFKVEIELINTESIEEIPDEREGIKIDTVEAKPRYFSREEKKES
ncbi:hypothetical protein [Natronosalvus caseinilyticus]|uniref:hypothetical protein n=1 Tax=Natronosalvus caseinilyticus TaxID=2953747 RepID=UPI0028A87329|nr:hypothetical protein [Natronosalvus caseinilyticus]